MSLVVGFKLLKVIDPRCGMPLLGPTGGSGCGLLFQKVSSAAAF